MSEPSCKETIQKLLDNVDENKLNDSSIKIMDKMMPIDCIANNVIKMLSACQKEKSLQDKIIEYAINKGYIVYTCKSKYWSDYDIIIKFNKLKIYFKDLNRISTVPIQIEIYYGEGCWSAIRCKNYEQTIDTIEFLLKKYIY